MANVRVIAISTGLFINAAINVKVPTRCGYKASTVESYGYQSGTVESYGDEAMTLEGYAILLMFQPFSSYVKKLVKLSYKTLRSTSQKTGTSFPCQMDVYWKNVSTLFCRWIYFKTCGIWQLAFEMNLERFSIIVIFPAAIQMTQL